MSHHSIRRVVRLLRGCHPQRVGATLGPGATSRRGGRGPASAALRVSTPVENGSSVGRNRRETACRPHSVSVTRRTSRVPCGSMRYPGLGDGYSARGARRGRAWVVGERLRPLETTPVDGGRVRRGERSSAMNCSHERYA